MKLIISLFFFLSYSNLIIAAAPKCSFIKHQYVEVLGDKVPKDLKNKILNNIIEDKQYVLKENPILGAKICTRLHPLNNMKDLPGESTKPGEEHLLVKVQFAEDKNFWKMSLLSFVKTNSKGLVPVSTSDNFTSSKPIKELKDVEVVDWVIGKLIQPIKKEGK